MSMEHEHFIGRLVYRTGLRQTVKLVRRDRSAYSTCTGVARRCLFDLLLSLLSWTAMAMCQVLTYAISRWQILLSMKV